jgi:hypothetical protein
LFFDNKFFSKENNMSVNYFKLNFTDSPPIINATMKTSTNSNFKTMRVQIYGPNQPKLSDQWWLNPAFTDHQLNDYLNYNDSETLFRVNINKNNNRAGELSNSAFHISASQPLDA